MKKKYLKNSEKKRSKLIEIYYLNSKGLHKKEISKTLKLSYTSVFYCLSLFKLKEIDQTGIDIYNSYDFSISHKKNYEKFSNKMSNKVCFQTYLAYTDFFNKNFQSYIKSHPELNIKIDPIFIIDLEKDIPNNVNNLEKIINSTKEKKNTLENSSTSEKELSAEKINTLNLVFDKNLEVEESEIIKKILSLVDDTAKICGVKKADILSKLTMGLIENLQNLLEKRLMSLKELRDSITL